MQYLSKAAICCWVGLLLTVQSAVSRTEECDDALERYKTAQSDVREALRDYKICIADRREGDDCAIEFDRLRSAQDDLESAVSAYKDECQ